MYKFRANGPGERFLVLFFTGFMVMTIGMFIIFFTSPGRAQGSNFKCESFDFEEGKV